MLRKVKLTDRQASQWSDTLAACSWQVPGFIHVLYTMMQNTGDDEIAYFTEDFPCTAGTDGFNLIIKPSVFFKLHLLERVFATAHEIMHEILNHMRMAYYFRRQGRITMGANSLPWDFNHSNICQDFGINAILVAASIGRINPNWLYDLKIADENSMWVDTYFKQWAKREAMKLGCGVNPIMKTDAPMVGRFDFHFDPGASQNVPPSQIPPRAEYEWDMAVKAAYEIQKAHGKMHPALEHFFDAVLRPVVDWTEHIRGLLTRIMGAGAYDWRRLDRRLITRGLGAPALSGHGAGLVIVGGDTSMSVFHDKTLVHRWLSELSGMIEDVQPEETRVLWCDTTVRRVDICSEPQDVVNLAFKGVPGGGGTNFNPVFDYVRENDLQPDVLLYLTDGDGKFPKREPEYPVIWGDISGNPRKYPFGQVVRIPIKTRAEA